MISNYADNIFLLAVVTNNEFVEPHFGYGVAYNLLPQRFIFVLSIKMVSKMYINR